MSRQVTKTAWGPLLILIAAVVVWVTSVSGEDIPLQLIKPDQDDDSGREITLVAKGNREDIYVDAKVMSSQRGRLLSIDNSREDEPWTYTVTAQKGEMIEVHFVVAVYAERIRGARAFSRCEIRVAGRRVAWKRDDITVFNYRDRDARTTCHYSD